MSSPGPLRAVSLGKLLQRHDQCCNANIPLTGKKKRQPRPRLNFQAPLRVCRWRRHSEGAKAGSWQLCRAW